MSVEPRERSPGFLKVEESVKLIQSMCARLRVRRAVRGLTPGRFDPSRAHERRRAEQPNFDGAAGPRLGLSISR
jgi:hypothetical protein